MFNKNTESISPDTPELVTAVAALTTDTPESNNLHKADPENRECTHTLELTAQEKSAEYPELMPVLSTFTATAERYIRQQPPETTQQTATPSQQPAPPLPLLNTAQAPADHDQKPAEEKTNSRLTCTAAYPLEKRDPFSLIISNESYDEITVRAEYNQRLSPNKPLRYPYFFDTVPAKNKKKIEIPRYDPNARLKKLIGVTLFRGKEQCGKDLDLAAIMTADTHEITLYSHMHGYQP